MESSLNTNEVQVERLITYNPTDAVGIGRLMPYLDERLSEEPMDSKLLQAIISSPYHEQLVARIDGIIVGAATMNLLLGPAVGRMGYLEDFVVDGSIQSRGVGASIWNEMVDWCREWGVDLSFTSNPNRSMAHRFYLKRGAEIRPTTSFIVPIKTS